MRLVVGLVLAGCSLFAVAASAQAAVIPVTNTSDNVPAPAGSLRAAIEAANSDTDLDVVDAIGVSGTINLVAAPPILTEDVEIRGAGPDALTVRRGMAGMTGFRIFRISLDVDAEISGLTIASGNIDSSFDGGAGIFNDRGTVTLRDTVIIANVNSGSSNGADGGGILNYGPSTNAATMMIVDSAVSGNTAEGGGAGIYNSGSASTLTVRRSLVSGNISSQGAGCDGGGGIKNDGVLRVENSTVAGNSVPTGAPVHGGGILTCGGSSARIVNSTIASNTASTGANLSIDRDGSAATLRSTIVADPRGGAPNCFVDTPPTAAFLTSNGFNLADDATCKLTKSTDQPSTNPLLAPLASNGGPTRTMALPPGSPAVNKGIAGGLTTDQRGLTRPVDYPGAPLASGGDGTDIGAFELQAPPEPPPSNEFTFGKVKKNKRKGTAKLTVVVPGPGEIDLAKTKKLKPDDEVAEGEGDEKLRIKPKRKAKKKLKRKGKAKLKAEVTYTPTGGDPNTKTKTMKLKRRR